jgi:hypothetical protein
LLQGYIHAQQKRLPVAWAPRQNPFVTTSDPTWHLPAHPKVRHDYLQLFDLVTTSNNNDDGNDVTNADTTTASLAVQRHVALQEIIRKAFVTDRQLGGKLTPKHKTPSSTSTSTNHHPPNNRKGNVKRQRVV